MQYFTEQAFTHREALDKVKEKYGEKAKILTHRTVRMGGFMGMFSREGIEITGYISNEPIRKKTVSIEEEKRKILNTVKSEQTLQQVLEEVQTLKDVLTERQEKPQGRDEHESLMRVEEILYQNDFTRKYIENVKNQLREKLSLQQLDDFEYVLATVREWIENSIDFHEVKKRNKPDIYILVGPTGVGKTTTIAKLAAIYGFGTLDDIAYDVRILTIDNYRIAAKQQIETYGKIMNIPVTCIESYDDLKKQLAIYNDVDMIFIDTIGKSPGDFMKLAEMRELLNACGNNTQVHLALAATTKTADIYNILQQFEPFGYQSVVLTKLDETTCMGNIISILSEKQKKLSFITNGQRVPQDICHADIQVVMKNMNGLGS